MQHFTKTVSVVVLLMAQLLLAGFTKISDPDVDMRTAEAIALGVWISDNGNEKFEIYKKDNKFYGKIVWTKIDEEEGTVKLDINNPDPAQRDQPIVGLEILTDFVYKGNGVYGQGRVYDPGSGNTYKCKIMAEGNTAKVRGYILLPLLGRTETAHRVID